MIRKPTTVAEAKAQGVATVDVPIAGAYVGLGRESSYQAARDGTLPVLTFGRRKVVPIAALEQMIAAVSQKVAA